MLCIILWLSLIHISYQDARADMERKNYDVCASEYDEDGNEVEEPSYNEYGDYVVYLSLIHI